MPHPPPEFEKGVVRNGRVLTRSSELESNTMPVPAGRVLGVEGLKVTLPIAH